MHRDTSLMRMVIKELAATHKWTFEETLDIFYTSKVCKSLSDVRTGIFTFAPREIIELFDEEYNDVNNGDAFTLNQTRINLGTSDYATPPNMGKF